jgi:hypothetical protein
MPPPPCNRYASRQALTTNNTSTLDKLHGRCGRQGCLTPVLRQICMQQKTQAVLTSSSRCCAADVLTSLFPPPNRAWAFSCRLLIAGRTNLGHVHTIWSAVCPAAMHWWNVHHFDPISPALLLLRYTCGQASPLRHCAQHGCVAAPVNGSSSRVKKRTVLSKQHKALHLCKQSVQESWGGERGDTQGPVPDCPAATCCASAGFSHPGTRIKYALQTTLYFKCYIINVKRLHDMLVC